jgi:hypothetical protein
MKKSKLVLALLLALVILSCKDSKQTENEKTKHETVLEVAPETIVKEESIEQQPTQAPDEKTSFVGTWSAAGSVPYIDIKVEDDGTFTIRELFDLESNIGTTYKAEYKDGVLVAIGEEENFYKWTLPTFKFVDENMDTMEYNSGLGPYELQKTDIELPSAEFLAPENND